MSNVIVNPFAGDVRLIAEVNGRKQPTCPIVRLHPNGSLIVDQGIFGTRHQGQVIAMLARLGYQTPKNNGKELWAEIQKAEAITTCDIPGGLLPSGQPLPYESGYLVKFAEAGAIKYACDCSAVRVFNGRGQNAQVVNTVAGVIALTNDAWAALMAANTKLNIVLQTKETQTLDLAIWEDSAAFVQANGPVPVSMTFRNGDEANNFAMPRGNQRQSVIAEQQAANAAALANDPIRFLNPGTVTPAAPPLTNVRPAAMTGRYTFARR